MLCFYPINCIVWPLPTKLILGRQDLNLHFSRFCPLSLLVSNPFYLSILLLPPSLLLSPPPFLPPPLSDWIRASSPLPPLSLILLLLFCEHSFSPPCYHIFFPLPLFSGSGYGEKNPAYNTIRSDHGPLHRARHWFGRILKGGVGEDEKCESFLFLPFLLFSPWDISCGPLRKAEKRREKQALKILWAFACVPYCTI